MTDSLAMTENESRATAPWVLLHAGALGDLVLALSIVRRLPGVIYGRRAVELITRTDPGELTLAGRRLTRHSLDGLGTHWLYAADDQPPPPQLALRLAGRPILSFLSGPDRPPHERLSQLGGTIVSVNAQAIPEDTRHITVQWERQIQSQGVLMGRCTVQKRRFARAHPAPDDVNVLGDIEYSATMDSTDPPHAGPVLIHPGSGGREKCWPLEAFLAVGERLVEEFSAPPTFIIGPVERDWWAPGALAGIERRFPIAQPAGANELTRLLAGASVLLGNDSGPSHLAALLGTPTITLFGPTDPRVWRPVGDFVQVIAGDLSRGPTWGISTDDVADKVFRTSMAGD